MSFERILGDLNAIFVEVLDDPRVRLTESSTAMDVEGWDSLSHVEIVVAIEKHFRIRFTAAEIQGFKNVGEMARSIQAKAEKA
ncbi:MAG: acyl carrier protein [Fibrobacteria bacterium]